MLIVEVKVNERLIKIAGARNITEEIGKGKYGKGLQTYDIIVSPNKKVATITHEFEKGWKPLVRKMLKFMK